MLSQNKLDNINIKVGNSSIKSSLKIRNLGIAFDAKMTFRDHIYCIYRKRMFQLVKIKHHSTSNKVLDKQQKIQNFAVKEDGYWCGKY